MHTQQTRLKKFGYLYKTLRENPGLGWIIRSYKIAHHGRDPQAEYEHIVKYSRRLFILGIIMLGCVATSIVSIAFLFPHLEDLTTPAGIIGGICIMLLSIVGYIFKKSWYEHLIPSWINDTWKTSDFPSQLIDLINLYSGNNTVVNPALSSHQSIISSLEFMVGIGHEVTTEAPPMHVRTKCWEPLIDTAITLKRIERDRKSDVKKTALESVIGKLQTTLTLCKQFDSLLLHPQEKLFSLATEVVRREIDAKKEAVAKV